MSANKKSFRYSDDSGLTLVELLVYITLLGIVSTLIVSFFINTVRTQSDISDMQERNVRVQSFISSVDIAIRNSSPQAENTGVLTSAAGNELLYVSNLQRPDYGTVVGGTDTASWQCSYWYYNRTNGTIQYFNSPTPLDTVSAPAGWTVFTKTVQNTPSEPVFTIDVRDWDTVSPTPTPTATSTGTPEASDVPPIRIGIDARTGDLARISTVISGLPIDDTGSLACRPTNFS